MVSDPELADALERLVVAGVALTSVAISGARPGFELTFPQWRVLVVLGEATDGARMGTVAHRVGVTLPATSRQLRRLERRGLVSVGRDELDRRAAVARLTPEGAAVRDAIVAYRRERLAAVSALFLADEAFGPALGRLADAVAGVG